MADGGGRDWDMDFPLAGGNRIPAGEIEELASRSSGPGGQHVNTSSTRVTLRWNVCESRGLDADARARLMTRLRPRLSREGVLTVHADRHRSRARNREMALARLRELVETALHQLPPRAKTLPTRASRRRRVDEKRRRGLLKRGRRNGKDERD
jgi:ribosome-associated protein